LSFPSICISANEKFFIGWDGKLHLTFTHYIENVMVMKRDGKLDVGV